MAGVVAALLLFAVLYGSQMGAKPRATIPVQPLPPPDNNPITELELNPITNEKPQLSPSIAAAPNLSDVASAVDTLPAKDWSKFSRIGIILKTGEGTISRAKTQLETVLKDYPSLVVVSDKSDEINGVQVHDVITGLKDRTYERLLKGWKGLPESKLNSSETIVRRDDEDSEVLKTQTGDGWDRDTLKFFPAIELAYAKLKNADWFVLIDDDSFIMMDNFVNYIEKFDKSKLLYIGSVNTVRGPVCGVTEEKNKFMHGGSGIVMSRPAVKKMLGIVDHCVLNYWSCWAGDVSLGLCMHDAGVTFESGEGFYGEPITEPSWLLGSPCHIPHVLHKLTNAQMRTLHNYLESDPIFKNSKATIGQAYNLFHKQSLIDPKDEKMTTDINYPGGDFWEGVESLGIFGTDDQRSESCRKKCIGELKCLIWVYVPENKKCYMKSQLGFRLEEKGSGVKAGVFRSRYNCIS
ncbi:hypothetical protein HK100_011373 [Physocladia obscura]|uniref:N-acetylgalactosaminide beta-1,3-galactosyltransferase n=1 Tax=Physocladia obscura TaxID=109957 RepID=A0AAD5T332_9FUNG|nr:hypothetical protein HK100_011373 [Physocladia obscura]